MSYVGDIRLGDTIDIKFTTRRADTSAPATLAGSPVISAYPGNSVTQLTAGITLSVDFDSVTGLNNCRVVASNGNGYATATNYALVITTGTVNSVSVVGEVIGEFSIEARSAVMPTTATRTLAVDASGQTTVGTVANNAITAAAIADAAIDLATFAADVGNLSMRSGTAQAGDATHITLDASASAVNDFYKNALIYITGGTGAAQSRYITGYVGATKVAAVTTWATNPDNTSTFAILPADAIPGATAPTAAQVATAVWTDTTAGDFTTALSVGKSVMNGVTLGTGLTIAAVSGSVGSVTGNIGGTLTTTERNAIADALLDRTSAIETGMTLRGAVRLNVAADAGRLSGAAGTAITIRDVSNTKDRITATVDIFGNRTSTNVDTT